MAKGSNGSKGSELAPEAGSVAGGGAESSPKSSSVSMLDMVLVVSGGQRSYGWERVNSAIGEWYVGEVTHIHACCKKNIKCVYWYSYTVLCETYMYM